jgi:outer membrane protein OmpA-like peptidoglycan-associated protein
MIISLKNKTWLFGALLLVSLAVGCASIENYQPLERVKATYSQLQYNNDVNNYAEAELYEANQFINKAESAADEGEKKLLDHYVYLSEKHLEIVDKVASRKANEAYIEELTEQRSNMLIQSRTQEAQQARDELETYKTKESDRGKVLVLDNLLFDTDGATLHSGSQRNLDPLVRYLNENPKRKISIEGHTDSDGAASYNMDLSFQRAEAVKSYLVISGIDENRINTKGFGESLPVASNKTAAGKQQNRRVEIVILD